jgi:hypothetical protein
VSEDSHGAQFSLVVASEEGTDNDSRIAPQPQLAMPTDLPSTHGENAQIEILAFAAFAMTLTNKSREVSLDVNQVRGRLQTFDEWQACKQAVHKKAPYVENKLSSHEKTAKSMRGIDACYVEIEIRYPCIEPI